MNRSMSLIILSFFAFSNVVGMEVEKSEFNPDRFANCLKQLSHMDSIPNMAHSKVGQIIVSEAEVEKPEVYKEIDSNIARLLKLVGPEKAAPHHEKFTTIRTLAKEQTDSLIPLVETTEATLNEQQEPLKQEILEKVSEIKRAQDVVIKLITEKEKLVADMQQQIKEIDNIIKLGAALKKIQSKEQTAAKNVLKALNREIQKNQEELKSCKAARKLLYEEKRLGTKGAKQLTELNEEIAALEKSIEKGQKQAKEMKEKLPSILEPTEEKGLFARVLGY